MPNSRPIDLRGRDRTLPVTVLFFDHLADAFGFSRRIEIPCSGCALSALRRRLGETVDGGRVALAGKGVRAAVDRVMVGGRDVWIQPGQDVAFFSLIAPEA